VSAVGSFFSGLFGGGRRDSKETARVRDEFVAYVRVGESQRLRLANRKFSDVVSEHPDEYVEFLHRCKCGEAAVAAFRDLSESQKRGMAEKFGVQILEILEHEPNSAVSSVMVELLLSLPEGLIGRIRSLFSARRAPSETEESLRLRVESELIAGFSSFPRRWSESFLLDNPGAFIELFHNGNAEVVAVASIILAAAPPEIRDDFVARHAKQLFHTIAMAPVVQGLTSIFLGFFDKWHEQSSECASACLAAIQSTKLFLECLPKLNLRAKEAIFKEAFQEFYLLVASFIVNLKPELKIRRTQHIMGGIQVRVSQETCNAFVAGKESPLAFLITAGEFGKRKGKGVDDDGTVVSSTMLVYVMDFLRRAPREAQRSFAVENPGAFWDAFHPLCGELPACCLAILFGMSDEERQPFIEANADKFFPLVLFSQRVEIRSAAARMIAQFSEAFLMEHGTELVRLISECKDQGIREFVTSLIDPFCDRFVIRYGKEVIEMFIGAADPNLYELGIRWIAALDDFSMQQFFLQHAAMFILCLGCAGEEKASLIARMLTLIRRAGPKAIDYPVAANGLMYCCFSQHSAVQTFGREHFRALRPDVRARALEGGMVSSIISLLGGGLLERLRSLLQPKGSGSFSDTLLQALPSVFLFGAAEEIMAKWKLTPEGRFLATQSLDYRALFFEIPILRSSGVQVNIFGDNEEVQLLFLLLLMSAFLSRTQGPSSELRAFVIALLMAHSLDVRVDILGKVASVFGWGSDQPVKPFWIGLYDILCQREELDWQYFRDVSAVGGAWNKMLEGFPTGLAEYLGIPDVSSLVLLGSN
jgi:hypothetical protein